MRGEAISGKRMSSCSKLGAGGSSLGRCGAVRTGWVAGRWGRTAVHRRSRKAFGSLCRGDRVYLDRLGLGVQRAGDRHFLSREFFRRLLVAQGVDVLTVIENVLGVVREDAGDGALGVVRSHSHMGVIGVAAHAIGDGAGEGLLALCGGEGCPNDQETDEKTAYEKNVDWTRG